MSWFHRGSTQAHRKEHVAFGDGLDRVRHGRVHRDGLAGSQPIPRPARFDVELTAQAVNNHVTWRAVLRQAAAGLEGETAGA